VKVVLSSTDHSFIQSAQIALDAHDIATVISSDNAPALPSIPTTLAVVADADFERAVRVLRDVQRTSTGPWWKHSRAPRAMLILVLILVVALCGLMVLG
jgi:Putative prokaryotic signal transducing protein